MPGKSRKRGGTYHRGRNYYIPFFVWGNYSWQLLQETLQHDILGGITYCNVMIGAVFPWKERIFRLQLQFFSLGYVGINCCNVTLHVLSATLILSKNSRVLDAKLG